MLQAKLLGRCRWILMGVLCLCWASGVQAQGMANIKLATSPAEAGLSFKIDIMQLLTSEELFPQEIVGPVWVVHPQEGSGKILIQVPLLITPGTKPVELSNTILKLTKGTFIGFRLNDFGESNDLFSQAKEDFREASVGSKRLMKRKTDPLASPPTVTKKFILMPDGKIWFKVGRLSKRHATILAEGDSLYRYKNDIKLYQELRPEAPGRGGAARPARPTRPTRVMGGDIGGADLGGGAPRRRATPTRRDPSSQREAQAASRLYRKELKEYLALGKAFRKLPKEIELEAPTRIWIIYEFDGDLDELLFSGEKPLPWKIDTEMLLNLRQVLTVKDPQPAEEDFDGVMRLTDQYEDVIFQLSELAAEPHPYNMQVAAITLSLTNLVPYAQLGDAQFFLLKALLLGTDSNARRFVLSELRQTLPPTRATIELAKLVVVQNVGDIREKSAAITEMVKAVGNDPQQASQTAQTINTMLQNEDGPPPEDLLRPLLEVGRENEEVRRVLMQSIRFGAMPENRLNDALVFIVENAGVEPLAAAWLNEHFLGSANRATLHKTLTVIAQADTGARDLGPIFSWAVDKLFGTHAQSANKSVVRKARMREPIAIESVHDSLYRALQHGDRKIRTLAWSCLSRFTMPLLKVAKDTDGAEVAPAAVSSSGMDRYQVLLEAALDQLPTPPSVVAFLERQPNKLRTAQTLIQVVLRGSPPVATAAVRSLVGGGGPLGDVMLELQSGERQGFAMLVYEIGAKRVPPPLVVNVLRRRESNSPIAKWFGDEVAKGIIPSTSAWGSQFEGEGPLLELVASNDVELAKGASAVLVSSVGGSDRVALKFLQQVAALGDQTMESVTAAWEDQKQTLFAAGLKRFEGHYRLSLMIADADDTGETEDFAMREIPVGVVQFRIDLTAKTASLGHDALDVVIGDRRHAIALKNPSELKSFPNEELAELGLDQVTEPILLIRQSDGLWKGDFFLEGGLKAQLQMISADKKATRSDESG